MFYMFLADGFEETEALATLDVMRRAGLNVQTVGVTGDFVTGSHNIIVKSDIDFDKISMTDIEGAVLPGGMPGTTNLESDSRVIDCVKYCFDNNKIVAAICAAPSILGHLGMLKGKKATCFPGFESSLEGAEHTGAHAEADGNVITGKGAGCAIEFGYEIVKKAVSKEIADKVISDMQCI
ncbi:MAG: DJ-1 family glyoxalase III [Ruminococcus sp.]|nr:DJ-1 family glyoxalase III [Ruminococcus sp.]